jgi:hypothetical protein
MWQNPHKHLSGTEPSYSLTLIANVASYFTLFKDFRTFNKREGWWISNSYILAVAQNMKRIANLFASHLQDLQKGAANGGLNNLHGELEKLLNILQSENMKSKLLKENRSVRTPIRTPQTVHQRTVT